jgi:hypothetical protein
MMMSESDSLDMISFMDMKAKHQMMMSESEKISRSNIVWLKDSIYMISIYVL